MPGLPPVSSIVDLGPYLIGKTGADHHLAEQLRWASENIGIYFIRNHGVDQSLINATFRQGARFHALLDGAEAGSADQQEPDRLPADRRRQDARFRPQQPHPPRPE